MTPALMGLARNESIRHPMVADILRANEINRICGGAVISPWEIDDLPMDWLDTFEGLAVDLPKMRKGQGQVESFKERWRKQHPQWR